MNLSDVVGFVGSFMNFKLFEINKTPITPSSVIMFLIVVALFTVTSHLLNEWCGRKCFLECGLTRPLSTL